MKKCFIILTASALITSPLSKLHAYEYVTDTGGCGYEDCCRSVCIVPAIGFAALMLAGIIAVGLQNRSHGGHNHSHSDCDCD
jgi:hypothetical protein